MAEAFEMNDEKKEIRKIRKKLRQIENLERQHRELNDEEEDKVIKKYELRDLLCRLTSELKDKGLDDSYNTSSSTLPYTSLEESDLSMTQNNSSNQFNLTSSPVSPLQSKGLETFVDDDKSVVTSDLNLSNQFDEHIPSVTQTLDTKESVYRPSLHGCHGDKKHQSLHEHPKAKKQKRVDEKKGDVSMWLDSSVVITSLIGHNDVICSVDTRGSILLTGSRDTTVKVWDIYSFTEQRSLGGHKSAVTCVKILPEEDEKFKSLVTYEEKNNCHFGMSGSLDCYIILWNLDTGNIIKQIYTYSSIQCLEYYDNCIFTGSEGGKVDVWSLTEGQKLHTFREPGRVVTCMVLSEGKLYCGDTMGTIQVWKVDNGDLEFHWNGDRMVQSEDEEEDMHRTSVPFISRFVRCISCNGNTIYWGDDGTNLKMLQWKKGRDDVIVRKLTNHTQTFGSTGGVAVCQREEVILSSGYDLDTGHAMINVRNSTTLNYICSIQDNQTSYISCMHVIHDDTQRGGGGWLRIVTGGNELQIWDVFMNHNKPRLIKSLHQRSISCRHLESLTLSYDTDIDTTSSSDDEQDDIVQSLHTKPLPQAKPMGGVVPQQRQSWIEWLYNCNIL